MKTPKGQIEINWPLGHNYFVASSRLENRSGTVHNGIKSRENFKMEIPSISESYEIGLPFLDMYVLDTFLLIHLFHQIQWWCLEYFVTLSFKNSSKYIYLEYKKRDFLLCESRQQRTVVNLEWTFRGVIRNYFRWGKANNNLP